MLEKLQPKLNISEEQQGFCQNRSTTDATFIIRQVVEKAIEFNVPAILCFVDLKKAFDRVKLSDVIKILREKEISKRLINVIKDLYTDVKVKIQVGDQFTNEISCTGGIRQGDSLSPTLFNLIMNKLVESIQPLYGYKINNQPT